MLNKYVKKLNVGLIILLILMIPCIFFLKDHIFLYFYQILYIVLPIEIFIYLFNIIKENIKISKYDVFIYILIILGVISTIFSVDVETSIWGAYSRNEGLFTILSYYFLFLNSKSLEKKEIKKVLKWLFGVGIIQFVYCILQIFVRGKYIYVFHSIKGINHMASGFVGNPNMLGSFCLLLLGIALFLYFVYNKKRYLILSVIFFINLLLAQSTGPFFAFIILFIFMIIMLAIKKIINVKKILLVLLIFVSSFFAVTFGSEKYCESVFGDDIPPSYTIKGDIIDTFSMFFSSNNNVDNQGETNSETTVESEQIPEVKMVDPVVKTTNKIEDVVNNYGSGRLSIWKKTLKIVPKYFWLGSGIDTFGYVYPNQNFYNYIDKAHNEYLQLLVTQGIFALITYLLLIFNLFIDGIKSKNKLTWVLLCGVIGYALQAFMNISVPRVAPFYFIVCGMLASTILEEKV